MSAAELASVEVQGVPVGRLLEIPVKWFLCSSNIAEDPLGGVTYRRFLRAARRIIRSTEIALEENKPDVIVVLNGLFLFEAIASHLARARGIRVVSYERGFIQGTLFFSHERPATRFWVPEEQWEKARESPMPTDRIRRLDRYLNDRRHGRLSHVDFWPKPRFDDPRLVRDTRRRVAVFTNLTWDSAVLGTDIGYPSIQEWLIDVIDHLAGRPDVSVFVRIHPAEIRIRGSESRERLADVIHQNIEVLPSNVEIVAADDPLSSYSLIDSCDLGLVYSSTTGLELALAGKPVIVAGEAHYANRGFTLEAAGPAENRALIDAALDDPRTFMPDVDLARRYADLFFFGIPQAQPPTYEPVGGLVRLAPDAVHRLRPGGDPGIDRLCDSILTGGPFEAE